VAKAIEDLSGEQAAQHQRCLSLLESGDGRSQDGPCGGPEYGWDLLAVFCFSSCQHGI